MSKSGPPEHTHDHSHWSDMELRVKTLESLLVEKCYVDPEALDVIVETYEHKVGPRNGAMVVAKAWSDPDYLQRLREDATAAIAELGFTGRQGEHMQVVENQPGLPQHGRLYSVFLLPMECAWAASRLVQVCSLSLPRG